MQGLLPPLLLTQKPLPDDFFSIYLLWVGTQVSHGPHTAMGTTYKGWFPSSIMCIWGLNLCCLAWWGVPLLSGPSGPLYGFYQPRLGLQPFRTSEKQSSSSVPAAAACCLLSLNYNFQVHSSAQRSLSHLQFQAILALVLRAFHHSRLNHN